MDRGDLGGGDCTGELGGAGANGGGGYNIFSIIRIVPKYIPLTLGPTAVYM